MAAESALIKATTEYSELTRECKAITEQRRARSPVQVEKTTAILANIEQYIEEQRKHNKPITHAGFMRCMGLNSKTYYTLSEYDHVVTEYKIMHGLPLDATEHITEDGEIIPLVSWSSIKEKICDIAIQEQLEENCYTNKGNPAGSIFGLKARFNWREDNGTQYIDKAVIIADGEQAKKSLKMLMD